MNNHDLNIADTNLEQDRHQNQIIHICTELKANSKDKIEQITINFLMIAIGEQHSSIINK